LVWSVDAGGDTRGCERLFGVFGFDVRCDDAWFAFLRTRGESDEDVTFDCGWENTEQGVVYVFTDQAVCIGVAGIRAVSFVGKGARIFT